VQVAVIDTGIDTDHPDLADNIIGEACLTFDSNGVFDPSRCPGIAQGHPAEDDNGHGTHVSGIITSRGAVAAPRGAAPNAGIFAYKVIPGSWAGIVAALDNILDEHMPNGVPEFQFINMSIGSGPFTYAPGECEPEAPPPFAEAQAISEALDDLRDQGVLAFIASGNNGVKQRMSFPGCVQAAVAVGATYDANVGPGTCDSSTAPDQVTCFSNSSDDLDVLAPGSQILSTWHAGFGVNNLSGTSMAAPHAAAAAALLVNAQPWLDPTDLPLDERRAATDVFEQRLKDTGVAVTDQLRDSDPATFRTTLRVDPWAALFTDEVGDFDLDGCTNAQEFGEDQDVGGLRNPYSFWDFFDVPSGTSLARDRIIGGADLAAIVARFGSNDAGPGDFNRNSDPLSTPNPPVLPSGTRQNYHPAYDRGGTILGASLWHLKPPNGSIGASELAQLLNQFGDTCL